MLIEKVRKLSPVERMLYFIQEREKVRLAKEAGMPKPWTDDVILQSYRFCNIRRMDDKVSKWLLENWYEPNFNHKNMLLAVALARFINKPETLERIGFPHRWNPELIKKKLRTWRDVGNVTFNSAYMVRGNDGIDKIECVVDHYVNPFKSYFNRIDPDSMEETHKIICNAYGIGSFMGGQIVADLRWAIQGKWSDRMDWAPIGPGSKRGMNRLHGRAINTPLNQAEFLTELREFIQVCEDSLPEIITGRMEAMDYQNTFCECDKYCRVLLQEGKSPKQRYPGA